MGPDRYASTGVGAVGSASAGLTRRRRPRDGAAGGRPDGVPVEHRLLRTYIDCIEAEGIAELVLRPGNDDVLTVTSGPEPVLTVDGAPIALPPDERTSRWCEARLSAADSETTYAGYPVVCGTVRRDGRDVEVLAALLYSECHVERCGDGFCLVARHRHADVNPFALDLLGVERDERGGYLEALGTLEGLADATCEYDRIRARVDFLRSQGLIRRRLRLDRTALSPLVDPPGVANAAIAFVGEPALTTRSLLADLGELLALPPEELRRGPLGVLLSAVSAPPPPVPRPQPTIVPSNLSQERAVTAALESVFSVVTGPPGTGKSQVLVNAVAAVLARGESVLFASKNNQAVDVVFERIADVAEEAVPLRAGAARLRAELARQMASGLARPVDADLGVTEARTEWSQVVAPLHPLYHQAACRDGLLAALAAAQSDSETLAAALPPALLGLRRSDALERALRRAAAAVARAAAPMRGLLKRRRAARRQQACATAAAALREALPQPAADELQRSSLPLADAVERVEQALELADRSAAVADLQRRLAGLPSPEQLEDAIREHQSARLQASRRLFGALWDARLALASADARSAAERYRERLQELATGRGGSARRLRQQVAGTLPMFPVWGVTNLSARTNFPLDAGMFDLVIIDEASQCDIASALPLLYRAKRAVVIGDRNQLPHICPLSQEREKALADRHGLPDEWSAKLSYRTTSLFAAAADRMGEPPILLDEHFRSHPAIIAFSNERFYGGRLRVLTDRSRLLPGQPLRWVDVRGSWARGPANRSAVNRPEAETVVAELVRNWSQGQVSVGVIAPFRAQVNLIRSMLAKRLPAAPEHVTVDTVHRFQGDERDIVLLSPTVAPGATPLLVAFACDPNLLNVAVTRPRSRLVIVGDREACRQANPLLKELADYVTRHEGRMGPEGGAGHEGGPGQAAAGTAGCQPVGLGDGDGSGTGSVIVPEK